MMMMFQFMKTTTKTTTTYRRTFSMKSIHSMILPSLNKIQKAVPLYYLHNNLRTLSNQTTNSNTKSNTISSSESSAKTRILTPELKSHDESSSLSSSSSSLFNEKKATAIQFNWFETETEYHIEARLLVGVNPNNLHLFIQNHQIVFETKSDSSDDKNFQSDHNTTIKVVQRSSLYLRRTIDIPKNVNEDSITAKITGDVVSITMPKSNNDGDESSRKVIKLES